jgi:hypothetical protein
VTSFLHSFATRSAARASAASAGSSARPLTRLTVSLPLPLPGDASRAVAPPDDSEFPGGVQQRFRQLSPCVDALLDGYGAAFKGCVDSPADGVGCVPPARTHTHYACANQRKNECPAHSRVCIIYKRCRRIWAVGEDATAISLVSNATVPALLRLLGGEFGARPTRGDHTVIAVNPSWSDSSEVGNFWEGALRQKAARALEGTDWEEVYVCAAMRRSGRGRGDALLLRAWPGPWRLLAMPDGQLIARWEDAPPGDAALAAALAGR